MGKEFSHFIIHFLIFYVLTMIEDIVERFYRNFFSYITIIGKKSINGIGTDDVLRCQDPLLLQYLINANIAIFIGEDLLALVDIESRPFRVRNSINKEACSAVVSSSFTEDDSSDTKRYSFFGRFWYHFSMVFYSFAPGIHNSHPEWRYRHQA